ncbi:uncharacterized protein PgNI_02263 [Pyricularia grisea]|uniref:Uncharacterized protein n=1 Tax=Pyricularia grisea TaxID=148305 RepID=A0A6P8BGK2_PYRGI|nr:uncharacterized protein PgNI_02263 [Pyricularia grisea]TLD15840.1 hypothetical protein PgNI_02263 [Pyricularia grisea]
MSTGVNYFTGQESPHEYKCRRDQWFVLKKSSNQGN